MSDVWYTLSVGDSSKGSTNNVKKFVNSIILPYPCVDTTDCTYYKVDLQQGEYKFETWGAQGGNDTTYPDTCFGGRGGYSRGTIKLKEKTTFYVFVGGSGTGNKASKWGSTGGGGATDIRLYAGSWNDTEGLKQRIIVSGGGGGRHGQNYEKVTGFLGNDAGGEIAPTFTANSITITGATQTSGGTSTNTWDPAAGSFGFANALSKSNSYSKGGYNGASRGCDNYANGGAGGGWWGGMTSWPDGSGGSGFVFKEGSSSSSQCKASTIYYLTNATTISGNETFPSPYGKQETGHTGNGVAKITRLDPDLLPSKKFFRSHKNLFIMCFLVISLVQGNLFFLKET